MINNSSLSTFDWNFDKNCQSATLILIIKWQVFPYNKNIKLKKKNENKNRPDHSQADQSRKLCLQVYN